MKFSGQEYWRGLLCLSPGDLPDPVIEHASPASPALAGGSVPLSHLGQTLTTLSLSHVDQPSAAPETEEPGDQRHGGRAALLGVSVLPILPVHATPGHAKGQAQLQPAVQ